MRLPFGNEWKQCPAMKRRDPALCVDQELCPDDAEGRALCFKTRMEWKAEEARRRKPKAEPQETDLFEYNPDEDSTTGKSLLEMLGGK